MASRGGAAARLQARMGNVQEEPPVAALDVRTVALMVSTVVVALVALHLAAAFFVPLLVSVFSSYALAPVVGRLERWRVPRALGAALAVIVVIAALAFGVERTINGATDVLEDLPRAVQKLRYTVTSWNRDGRGPLKQMRKTADELQKLAGAAAVIEPPVALSTADPPTVPVTAPASTAGSLFAMGTVSMTVFLVQIVSVLFLTYFLLAAGNLFRQNLIATLGPSLSRRKKALQILHEVNAVSQRYFALVLMMNVVVGFVTGLGMYLLGVRHPVFWGTTMAILHTVPYLGAAAVTGAVALSAYLQFESVATALLAAAVPLAAATVIGVWLQTALMGRAVGMNAAAVFVALLFWGMMWGGWGLLLAFPIMASAKIVCGQIERLKPLAVLMSN
jgi:predicted PurR-regulated permease PerM